jgi:hypothetical protein
MEVCLLLDPLVLRLFFGGPICWTSGWRALGFAISTVLVVMAVDVSRSEYERICLDMAEVVTKGLDVAFLQCRTLNSRQLAYRVPCESRGPVASI